ncbi:MAG TPA: hypothetical protein PKE30_00405 [Niabella sp.]|nr:hypothetical protein [Niabella sp.]
MKFFISIITIAVISFITGLYLPWWSIALVSFIIALLIHQRPLASFISGFASIFVFWMIIASLINTANNSILANRIGEMLGIGQNPVLLIFITALIGGLVGGFAALSASYLRRS